jgi:glyoxylase-like metal-dependent hydrolase (beta-lactamase superfamily II)
VCPSRAGHTAGHQSLLVHLNQTGYVLLIGDAVHFQSNWDNRRIPGFNADRQLPLDSMDKLARIADEKHPSSGSTTTNRRSMHVGMLQSFTISR